MLVNLHAFEVWRVYCHVNYEKKRRCFGSSLILRYGVFAIIVGVREER